MEMILAGLDIGGTKCAAILAECGGGKIEFISRDEIPTKGSWREIADRLIALLRLAAEKNGIKFSDIKRIGISCGGPLDSQSGTILCPPNLPGWNHVPFTDYVTSNTGIEARLLNDADACALAEWRYGAGAGVNNMIFLTFGTGLGAGLILGGRLYAGTNGMAGEVGHIRLAGEGPVGYGKRGSFEGFCSGGGIAQSAKTYLLEKLQSGSPNKRYKTLESLRTVTAKDIAALARAGDEDCLEIYRQCGKNLGRGLSVLVDILNPERIVIGGIFMRAHKLMSDRMDEELKKECLPRSYEALQIVPAALGERIGDYGAVAAGSDF